MGYAATYLGKMTGAHVDMRDSIAVRESYESYLLAIAAGSYDFIFIESASPSWEHDSKLIRRIHDVSKGSKIVVAGPITATGHEQIMANLPVHACIRGEYEKGSVKVMNGAAGLIDYDLLTEQEMNESPFPYYDSVIALRYWDACPKGQVSPHAHVWSSRGCPYKCIFCVWPATMTGNDPDGTKPRRVRHYSADYMEAFLREIVGRYGYKSIYFDDDTFNLGDKHMVNMCQVMRKIGLPWSAMCRADTVKPETWVLMRQSGCFGVKLGFESGSQEVINNIVNKHLNLEKARATVFDLKRLGFTVHGTFTYGLPGETQEQMQQTRDYIRTLPLDSLQESGCAEIEGTPLNTLTKAGNLARYKGAKIDQAYVAGSDGARKFDAIADKLR